MYWQLLKIHFVMNNPRFWDIFLLILFESSHLYTLNITFEFRIDFLFNTFSFPCVCIKILMFLDAQTHAQKHNSKTWKHRTNSEQTLKNRNIWTISSGKIIYGPFFCETKSKNDKSWTLLFYLKSPVAQLEFVSSRLCSHSCKILTYLLKKHFF